MKTATHWTDPRYPAHNQPAPDSKTGAGLGGSNGAVNNRTCNSERGFFAPGFNQFMVARTGEPQGSPVLHRSANPVSGYHPLAGGGGFQTATGANAMAQLANLTFEATTFEIVDQNGQPWMRMRDIIKALYEGDDQNVTPFENAERAVKRVFEKNRDEFTDAMTAVIPMPTAGGTQDVRVFSFRGAHLLGMLAKTKKAKAFRVWLLDLIEREGAQSAPLPNLYRQGKTDKLSAEQQQALRQLLEENVKRLPHAAQAGAMIKGWSKLKSHFGVGYRDIPAERYPEAVNLLTRHLSELLDPQAQAMALSDKERIGLALKMATQVSSEVTVAVLNAVLSGNDNWKSDRWMFGLTYKAGPGNDPMVSWASQVPHSACVMSMDEMAKAITAPDGLAPTDAELANLASACTQRLASRMSTRPNQPLALSA